MWSTCTHTCGAGYMFRRRNCTNSRDAGQEECVGPTEEVQNCNNGGLTDIQIFHFYPSLDLGFCKHRPTAFPVIN